MIAGLAIVVAVILLLGGGGAAVSPSSSPGSSAGSAYGVNCPTSQPAALPAGETRTVKISTAQGDIVIQVKADLSPIATGNFVALAQCGFYDGVVFHRLVPGFVIQGGDPAGNGSGGPGYTIADDPITGTYTRGTVAMARTTEAHSQGSQFFIILSDDASTALTNVDPTRGYAILGEVTAGMDVVDKIAAMPNSGSPDNTAIDPVAMTSVTVATP